MFNYSIIFQCDIIGGRSYEFHKEWSSPTQLRAGDIVHFDALEEVRVKKVVWYLDMPGHAFVELQDQRCEGTEKDWQNLFDEMDCSIP